MTTDLIPSITPLVALVLPMSVRRGLSKKGDRHGSSEAEEGETRHRRWWFEEQKQRIISSTAWRTSLCLQISGALTRIYPPSDEPLMSFSNF